MMATETEIVDVIFRVDREGNVFALMPGLAGTRELHTCTCFEINGGHSSADLAGCIRTSRRATEDESARTLRTLTNYGYVVNVVSNATRRHAIERGRQINH